MDEVEEVDEAEEPDDPVASGSGFGEVAQAIHIALTADSINDLFMFTRGQGADRIIVAHPPGPGQGQKPYD